MRIVLKISGESLNGESSIDKNNLSVLLSHIKKLQENNELLIVVGGGNFWRGRNDLDIDSSISDKMGMLATSMNGLALCSYLNKNGVSASLYGAFDISGMVKCENVFDVYSDLSNGKVVIFVGGLGVVNLSTDMTTVSKAMEYKADLILMSKNIDGVYDKEPIKDDARKLDVISHKELLDLSLRQGEESLMILDIEALAALVKCKIPMIVYKYSDLVDIEDVINGKVGTIVLTSKKV